ncbi:hypothetical protein DFH08DRAFT_824607 [Mycena albidolilacea]|uniref:Uncharacterized protein n=1 Tax=Mycena albidolilacea TaxID=1033008 RepID=A0AAD6Z3M5_9AGAR|nr:hypothetical protein DFH08DRAFT_824607 [Mycena albidolilacea]
MYRSHRGSGLNLGRNPVLRGSFDREKIFARRRGVTGADALRVYRARKMNKLHPGLNAIGPLCPVEYMCIHEWPLGKFASDMHSDIYSRDACSTPTVWLHSGHPEILHPRFERQRKTETKIFGLVKMKTSKNYVSGMFRLCSTYICPKRQTPELGGSFYKRKLLNLQRYPSEGRNTVNADVYGGVSSAQMNEADIQRAVAMPGHSNLFCVCTPSKVCAAFAVASVAARYKAEEFLILDEMSASHKLSVKSLMASVATRHIAEQYVGSG